MTLLRTLGARWLGRQRYEPVLTLQRKLFQERQAGTIEDTVLFVEHDAVITLGRGSKPQHLLASRELLGQLGVDLAEVERGSRTTCLLPNCRSAPRSLRRAPLRPCPG